MYVQPADCRPAGRRLAVHEHRQHGRLCGFLLEEGRSESHARRRHNAESDVPHKHTRSARKWISLAQGALSDAALPFVSVTHGTFQSPTN